MAGLGRHWVRKCAATALLVLAASCQAPPPPAPPPPPPPAPTPTPTAAREVIPYRPIPPNGAAYTMNIPPAGSDGIHRTINSDLDSNEEIWRLRSAWNVAALNCLGAPYQPILDGYKAFLRKYRKQLSAVNSAINRKFRKEYSSHMNGLKAREAHSTQVYNYFAMPPVLPELCKAARQMALDEAQHPAKDLETLAATGLPRLEAVYQDFYDAYDAYRVASAAWDAKYGEKYGYSQPGYVAVHGSATPGIASSLNGTSVVPLAGTLTDPETGAKVPLVGKSAPNNSTPVVQPIPKDAK